MKLRIGLLVTLLATTLRISHAQDDSLAGSFLSGMCHRPKIPTRRLKMNEYYKIKTSKVIVASRVPRYCYCL